MKIARATISTPLGDMLALSSDDGLCALECTGPFDAQRRAPRAGPPRLSRLKRRLTSWFPPYEIEDRESRTIIRTRAWLRAYFDGASAEVGDLPLDMRGADFEKRVWRQLLQIPAGETTSYGAIAKALSSISASRAVGLANGSNPIAIIVPCHRVIGSNGSLTGYGGGLDRKTWLIDHERQWRKDGLF